MYEDWMKNIPIIDDIDFKKDKEKNMSNKIVDGVELLRMIRDGELKERNKYKYFIKWKKSNCTYIYLS